MAGKKQAKKAGAKKAVKKAAAKKAPAKKAPAKKAAGKKKASAKPARLGMGKPARATLSKGEVLETAEFDTSSVEKIGKHWEQKWAKIIAKTWTDPDFKAQLLESPARTLSAEGLPLLRDVDVRIVSGEGRFTMEIPLPERPGDLEGEVIDDLLGDLLGDKFKPKKCVMSSCCC